MPVLWWALRLQYTFDVDSGQITRRVAYDKSPTWNDLATKVTQLFFIPPEDVALSYIDYENDQMTMSSQAELESFILLHSGGPIGRFKMKVLDLGKFRQSVLSIPRSM
jgi:hypothetical protein